MPYGIWVFRRLMSWQTVIEGEMNLTNLLWSGIIGMKLPLAFNNRWLRGFPDLLRSHRVIYSYKNDHSEATGLFMGMSIRNRIETLYGPNLTPCWRC